MVSKLLSSVLDKVSEENNVYRMELRDLNKEIDEKTTALVGDVVTSSNYTIDFSSALTNAKEKLVNPISRIIESYVIRDLRSVETVNEQFVEKINDKIDNANINTNDEKDNFIQNLNTLLNEKYLEIVKIKRVDFLNDNGVNEEIENCVNDFVSYVKTFNEFENDKLNGLVVQYKNSLYDVISNTLAKISDLYLNNFVSEVSDSLNVAIDFNGSTDDLYSNEDSFKPYIPNINEFPEVEIPSVPEMVVDTQDEISQIPEIKEEDSLDEIASIPSVPDVPAIQEMPEETSVMDVTPIAPIEVTEESLKNEPKRTYDVEEILKIAKSPIVTMVNEEDSKSSDDYVSVSPIETKEDDEHFDSEFDEREIVEEMISRLNKRLALIKERQEKYDSEKRKLEEDETFVNDLIQSSNAKRDELDKFEEELNNKEKEIEEKQKELNKKINDVLPFADAIMKSSGEEA